jgi:hypothetical protein
MVNDRIDANGSRADHHHHHHQLLLQSRSCTRPPMIGGSAINAAINAVPALIAGGGGGSLAAAAMIGGSVDHQSEAMARAKSRVSVRAKCDGPMVGSIINTSDHRINPPTRTALI